MRQDSCLQLTFETSQFPESMLITDPEDGKQKKITFKMLYDHLARHIGPQKELSLESQQEATPTVAFVLRWCRDVNGGLLLVRRYVEWLREAGIAVTVYGDDLEHPPWWRGLDAEYVGIVDPGARLSQVKESTVIFFSVFDLPWLGCIPQVATKQIFHLCQGVESHLWGNTIHGLLCHKPIFDLLHSLPIQRIVVSKALESYFQQRFNQKSFLIPNGIDTDLFTPSYRDAPRKHFLRALTVGKPTHFLKGASTITSALTLFKRQNPEVELNLTVVAGSEFGDEERQLLRDVPYELQIRTGCSGKEMSKLYREHDLYLNSSLYEGFGLPSLESMASGTPVIQTDNFGLTGIVRDGENCLLVPPMNPRAMALAIERICFKPDLWRKLAIAGVKVAEGHSQKIQKERFEQTFSSILGQDVSSHAKALCAQSEGSGGQIHIEVKDHNLFSILMPTYNQAQYLDDSIGSVLQQQYPHWELVITNDGSIDCTEEVLKKYALKDSRIRVYRKENGGTGSALNWSLERVKGNWVCWLSSDDYYEPHALATWNSYIKARPARAYHSDHSEFNEIEGVKRSPSPERRELIPSGDYQVFALLQLNYINGISICLEKALCDEVGFFDESNRSAQDFDYWLRIAQRTRWEFIDSKVVTSRYHPFVEAVSFPEAGIFCSAASAMNFLNKYSLGAVLGHINHSDRTNIIISLQEALKVLLNPQSLIYQGVGYVAQFEQRLRQWISEVCDKTFADLIRGMIRDNILRPALDSGLPDGISAMVERLAYTTFEKNEWRRYDPWEEFTARLSEARLRQDARSISLIERFLKKCAPKAVTY